MTQTLYEHDFYAWTQQHHIHTIYQSRGKIPEVFLRGEAMVVRVMSDKW